MESPSRAKKGKIIKAVFDFTAEGGEEISFKREDLFVIIDDSQEEWYYVTSAAPTNSSGTKQTGFVPKTYFTFRHEFAPRESNDSAIDDVHETTRPTQQASLEIEGEMMYDFFPETSDEMAAKAGDKLVVLAETEGWYLAKHLNRKVPPGLVPASYVQTKDELESVPSVREWKRRQSEQSAYSQQSTKSLATPRSPIKMKFVSQYNTMRSQNPGNNLSAEKKKENLTKSLGALKIGEKKQALLSSSDKNSHVIIDAGIPTYQSKGSSYIFITNVSRTHGLEHYLYRKHEDFLALQKKLMEQFPAEAGTFDDGQRILPYMPAPLDELTPDLVPRIRHELDNYIRQLVKLPHYISKCSLVLQFFLPRPYDPKVPNLRPEKSMDGGELVRKYSRSKSEDQHNNISHKPLTPMITTGIKEEEESPNNSPVNKHSNLKLEPHQRPDVVYNIKILEPHNVSYLNVTRSIRFSDLLSQINENVGKNYNNLLIEKPLVGSLQPVTNDTELQNMMDLAKNLSLVVHI